LPLLATQRWGKAVVSLLWSCSEFSEKENRIADGGRGKQKSGRKWNIIFTALFCLSAVAWEPCSVSAGRHFGPQLQPHTCNPAYDSEHH